MKDDLCSAIPVCDLMLKRRKQPYRSGSGARGTDAGNHLTGKGTWPPQPAMAPLQMAPACGPCGPSSELAAGLASASGMKPAGLVQAKMFIPSAWLHAGFYACLKRLF